MKDSEKLRKRRLIFYENDIREINDILQNFLEASKAKAAILIDIDGHLVTRRGDTQNIDITSVAALVAGSFASTKQVASLLGEPEFSVLFHQGKHESIHISLIAERTMLVILFNDNTTIGMVRLYANEVARKIEEVLERQTASEPELSEDLAGEAKDKLEDLFSE
ncbi:MAG: roadblock/LC7 domain-containing protein [Planctomycetota bacterium]|nr:MAG: roadblock/LC7 domain-containing protein [Planctomycetota bacterium]